MKRKDQLCSQPPSFINDLPEDVPEADLITNVHQLNSDPEVNGMFGTLSRSGINIKGQRAVVVGRSNIVGLPVSLLLLKADATVTTILYILRPRIPMPAQNTLNGAKRFIGQ